MAAGEIDDRVRSAARRAVDGLRRRPVLTHPMVSIEFDDGYRSALQEGLPVLQQSGWTATQYVVSGEPSLAMERGTSPLMSHDEIRDWACHGDVGCHGATHRRAGDLRDVDVRAETAGSRAAVEAVVGRSVDLFAAPFGETDERLTTAARSTFRSQRLLGGGVNTAARCDPFGLRSIAPRSTTPPEEIGSHLERAKRRRGWLILVWHRVGEPADSPWNVSTTTFRRQLAAIERSGIEVVRTGLALDRIEAARSS